MTKLEEDLFFEIEKHEFTENMAAGAAEVCKGYIERAFDAGGDYALKETMGAHDCQNAVDLDEWLKSEGITE